MCLFTSALRASVNKSHIPSLPQNNLYVREFKTKQPGEQTNNNKKQKTKQVKQPTIPNKGETTYIYIYI